MNNAFNFITYTEYSGSNAFLEGKGKYNAFATFLQIKQNGYRLNKNAKGISIFCGYKSITEVDKNGKSSIVSVPKRAFVFDIADTNALDDKKLVEKLETERPKKNMLEVGQIIVGSILK